MKILVINFPLRPDSEKKLFPIGLGYITTAIKLAGYDFELCDLDANRECDLNKKLYEKWDVVCLGSLITGYKKIKEICNIIKLYNPNAKIIVGNSAATSIPVMLLKNTEADIAVMAEGDETIIDILNCLRLNIGLKNVKGIYYKKLDGEIVKTEDRGLIEDINKLPLIDFDIFDIEEYIKHSGKQVNNEAVIKGQVRALPISTARGCINNCTFCYHVFKGKKYRYRIADSIVGDVKRLIEKYSLNYINFWDELTFFSKKQANELAQKIIDSELKFAWIARCRANLFDKDEDTGIISKMRDAGCCGVQFSLESSDPEILKEMKKNITTAQFSKQVKLFQKSGLTAWTSLVFGYPQENPQTIKNTIDCCIENNLYPSSGYLLPQPGSPMYEYAKSVGKIIDEEEYILRMGDRQDLTINLTKMSDEEFVSVLNSELDRANKALGINLGKDNLIKTNKFITTK